MSEQPGCLTVFFRALAGQPQRAVGGPTDTPLYRVRDRFLSPAEGALYEVLAAVDSRYVVFGNVRLADLVNAPAGKTWQSSFNRISGKQIDFVICDRVTFRPRLAVELDDSTHARRDRVDRDAFVNEALKAAGLPLLRFRVQMRYDAHAIAQQVADAIEAAQR